MSTVGSMTHPVPRESATPPAAFGGSPAEAPASPLADRSRRITTPRGLPGFPGARSFQLDPIPGLEASFMMLRATDTSDLGFVVLAAGDGTGVYGPDDLAEIRAALGAGVDALQLLLLVTMAGQPGGLRAFVNLRAPLAIDTAERIAAQVVLTSPVHPLRHPLEQRTPAPATA